MTVPILAALAGLALLTWSSDHFVVGAARLSATLRVSAVIIGAVVIGFGTSLPELVVSGIAAGQGSIDLAVGNIVGSNVANLTLVLGVAALILPPSIHSQTLRREAPLSAASVVLFALLLQVGDGLTRLEGLGLLALLVVSLGWIVRAARRGNEADLTREVAEFVDRTHVHPLKIEIPRTLLGMAGTLAGAQLLVYGALEIAETVGIAEGFVGLTLVAVGTSLPELVTAIQSARKAETDLIIGNLLGSNIFNSLAVGGLAATVGPGRVDPSLSGQAAAVMVAVALLAWLFMHTGRRVARWEAVVLLAGFPAAVVLVGI